MKADRLELDERRELHLLLERLTPKARIEFVQWACGQVRNRGSVGVTTHSGTVREAYLDLVQLELAFGLSIEVAARELERRVRAI